MTILNKETKAELLRIKKIISKIKTNKENENIVFIDANTISINNILDTSDISCIKVQIQYYNLFTIDEPAYIDLTTLKMVLSKSKTTIDVKENKIYFNKISIDIEEIEKIEKKNKILSIENGDIVFKGLSNDFIESSLFVGRDETRPVLMYVNIDKGYIYGTDAHSMRYANTNYIDLSLSIGLQTISMLQKDVEVIIRKIGDGFFTIYDNTTLVHFQTIDVSSMPNVSQVIGDKASFKYGFDINTKHLVKSLKDVYFYKNVHFLGLDIVSKKIINYKYFEHNVDNNITVTCDLDITNIKVDINNTLLRFDYNRLLKIANVINADVMQFEYKYNMLVINDKYLLTL